MKIGAEAGDTHGALDGVELVILAIPLSAIANFPETLFEDTPQTTLSSAQVTTTQS